MCCPVLGHFGYLSLTLDWNSVIFRAEGLFATIGSIRNNLSAPGAEAHAAGAPIPLEVRTMIQESTRWEGMEISPRFRRSMEERILRLERGADFDEAQLELLIDEDHIRRQRKLVAVERAEVLRMRLFLDKVGTRLPSPLIKL